MAGERPILFSGPMVRALLAGRKTQTRRLVKPQPRRSHWIQPMWGASPDGFEFGDKGHWREAGPDYPDGDQDDRRCPFGQPGDRLWVRETWARRLDEDHLRAADLRDRWAWYWADPQTCNTGCAGAAGKKRPAIHMPRWASRLLLEVIGVRAQRLQEVAPADVAAEGLDVSPACPPGTSPTSWAAKAGQAFGALWDAINGKRAPWAENPWVWAVTFRVVHPAPRPPRPQAVEPEARRGR